MKANDVRSIEKSFILILKDARGTKKNKQSYFFKRGIRIPRTSYERMWDSLVEKLGRVGAGNAIFDYVMFSANSRLKEVLDKAQENGLVELKNGDPVIVSHLFHNNGKPKRITEHLLEYLQTFDLGTNDKKLTKKIKKETSQVDEHLITDIPTKKRPKTFKYDVALSFAGEDRDYVEKVAKSLKNRRIKVFYDKFKEVELWGKNLYDHLDEVYRTKARYCVMFISIFYKNKVWTNHERESAQARAFQEQEEYILPVRFDNTEIPGVLPTVGYKDANEYTPEELADMIFQKVKGEDFEKEIHRENQVIKNRIKTPTITDRGSRQFNIEKAQTKIDLLKDSEIKGQTRLDIWDEFRHLFPPITNKELSNEESKCLKRVVGLIQEDFDDENFWERGLDILAMISSVQNKYVVNKIKKMSGKIKDIYDELPTTEHGKGKALRIFHNIAKNKDKFCRELIEHCINEWTEEEFKNLRYIIEFDELKNKEAVYKRLYKHRSELEETNDVVKVERVKKIIMDLNRYR